MADAAGRKGFSGRLMGMKFMQRAALKLGKRKADDALSAAAPSDASSPPAPPEAPDTAPDTAPETAPDVTVLLHRGKTRCRVIVQASVHEGQAQLLAGRKSFAQGADEDPPEDSKTDAMPGAAPTHDAPAAQPPTQADEGPPTKKRRGLSQLLNKSRRR